MIGDIGRNCCCPILLTLLIFHHAALIIGLATRLRSIGLTVRIVTGRDILRTGASGQPDRGYQKYNSFHCHRAGRNILATVAAVDFERQGVLKGVLPYLIDYNMNGASLGDRTCYAQILGGNNSQTERDYRQNDFRISINHFSPQYIGLIRLPVVSVLVWPSVPASRPAEPRLGHCKAIRPLRRRANRTVG